MPTVNLAPTIGTTASAVTPYRETQVRFDVAESVTTQFPFSIPRAGRDLMRAGFKVNNSKNTYQLLSGAIALKPFSIGVIRQTLVPNTVVPLSDWNVSSLIVSQNTWRAPSDLPGVIVSGVQATGDAFYQKSLGAGVSWNDTHNASDVASHPGPAYTPAITLERSHVGKVSYPPDQAFTIRVNESENAHVASTDDLGRWYFGGPLSARGDGEFCVHLFGTGEAVLSEHIPNLATGDGWLPMAYWQYAPANSIPGHMIILEIFPHTDAHGNSYIQFTSELAGTVQGSGLFTRYFAGNTEVGSFLYAVPARSSVENTTPPAPVTTAAATGSGIMRIDMPQNKRTPHQVALHQFPATGFAQDGYFQLPFGHSGGTPIVLSWSAATPGDSMCDVKIYDANTNTELTLTGSGLNTKTYTLNAIQPNYYAIITLTASTDGSKTPLFWSYQVIRDGVQGDNAPGEFIIPDTYPLAAVRQVSVTGPEADPSHETALLSIEDPAANLGVLNTRAVVRAQLRVRYDKTDRTKWSVIADGYATRNPADRKGSVGRGGFVGGGDVRAFPSSEWRHFESTWLGMWTRLERNLSFFPILSLLNDLNAPEPQPPFKVTDVVRALLGYCGFTDDQIDVPDAPIRFATAPEGYSSAQLAIEPLAKIASLCTQFLRDFLGWFLVWDANAGTTGMWRAIAPSIFPYNNLANFTTDAPAHKLPHRPESYGTPNWVGVNPTVFIRKGTLKTSIDPPEANAVCVTATGKLLPSGNGQFKTANWMLNLLSYNAVDGVVTADPTNPDYLGFFSPLVYVNTSIGDGGVGGGNAQHAVDILCRRLFDLTCHAVKRAYFDSPLCLVTNTLDSLQTNPRPLRYYDAVTVTANSVVSQWLVRNGNPFWRKDSLQLQHMEIESPRF